MRRMRKRGVSPLIAAVMLMVLTVVVGALIMNWVNRYVKEQVESGDQKTQGEMVCGQDVRFNLFNIDGDVLFCANESSSGVNYTEFTIENGPSKKLEGVRVRVINSDGTVCDSENSTEIGIAAAQKIHVVYDGTACDSPTVFRIFPLVSTTDIADPVVCTDNYIDVNNWDPCQ